MLSATEYFASYEEEFLSIIQGIERLVLRYTNSEDGGGREKMGQEEIVVLERRFYDAKKCLDQLRDERYQRVYDEIYTKFDVLREESTGGGYYSNNDLDTKISIGGSDGQQYLKPSKEYNMGVSTEDLVKRNEDNLRISAQLAQETKHIGLYSLNTLTVQRDNLTRSKYGLNNIDYNIMESRKLASTLYKQKVIERLFLYFIIFVLLMANIYVFFRRVFGRG
ncbi:V-SNARE-like protein [Cryptosporidium canis]|uniref:V-SNARE-like protein n=1 Tax=Cryptosporidium canis TaxID=195482 RepID=A0A9D5DFF8_9CRYT|nr:V-SNARE-like protein [Cryptosporidium canis]